MATPTVYVICNQNCKYEAMTKEQILTAITQAVEEGTVGDVDTGFVTTIKTINGTPLKFFVGTQAEFEDLTNDERTNLFAIITNDTTKDTIVTALEELKAEVKAMQSRLLGTTLFSVAVKCTRCTVSGGYSTTIITGAEITIKFAWNKGCYFDETSCAVSGADFMWDPENATVKIYNPKSNVNVTVTGIYAQPTEPV